MTLLKFISGPQLPVNNRLILGLIAFIGMSAVTSACDDPPPNTVPTIIGDEVFALCERKEGAQALVEINFVIEDSEGSDTLLTPYVEYRGVSITVEGEPIPAPTAEELSAAKEAGVNLSSCSVESCRMRYSWTYDRNDAESGLIRCTEDVEPVYVWLKDVNDNEQSFQILPEREE